MYFWCCPSSSKVEIVHAFCFIIILILVIEEFPFYSLFDDESTQSSSSQIQQRPCLVFHPTTGIKSIVTFRKAVRKTPFFTTSRRRLHLGRSTLFAMSRPDQNGIFMRISRQTANFLKKFSRKAIFGSCTDKLAGPPDTNALTLFLEAKIYGGDIWRRLYSNLWRIIRQATQMPWLLANEDDCIFGKLQKSCNAMSKRMGPFPTFNQAGTVLYYSTTDSISCWGRTKICFLATAQINLGDISDNISSLKGSVDVPIHPKK